MSQSARDSKPRATKNSQRLYNLEQQEKLYNSLGISKPLEEVKESGNSEDELMEDSHHNENPSQTYDSDPEKVPGGSDENKKGRRLSKDSHIMSESESEKEMETDKIETDSAKKLKKKRKRAQMEDSIFPKAAKGKKLKLQNLDKKGKKSPSNIRGKGKKGVNVKAPAISLPEQLLVSPEDSSVIAAHMNAYTKWLMDNNMLISQQSLNQYAGQGQVQNNMAPPQDLPNTVKISLPAQPTVQNLSQRVNANKTQNFAHDLSTDESSNVDPSEVEGQPPFVPQNQAQQSGNIKNQPLSVQQGQVGNGELFEACEAEKNVSLDDDNSVGPAVSEQMAEMVKNFLGRSRKTAKIDDLLQEFLRPKNMPYLKAPFIEDEIYGDLAGGGRNFDKNCRQLQGYIFAAVTALTSSLQSLILTEKLHPLITDAGVRVKKAIQLLTFSTKEINDRRKDALKSSVNAEYLPLLKHAKPPSPDWLLGGELTESIKKCDDSKKLTEKIMKNRKTSQNTQPQGQTNSYQNYNQGQERYKYKNRGKKDNKPFYRNYQQNQGNQQGFQTNQAFSPQPSVHYNQGFQQPQVNQQQLWQQYQQQLQHAQAIQAQVQNRQNLGFLQQQQLREQTPPQQGFNYNQKKKT